MGEAERQRIFSPSKLRGATLRNRVIKTATYEELGHGYLLSQFLCPAVLRRVDRPGGVRCALDPE
jgi:2,4-dienoyl-CoA reductase-like NADH-dependent reductase (Old Yellow Enzyme family)